MPQPSPSYSLGEWSPYTPTWTSTGTQPSLGNGSLFGYYWNSGDILAVEINLSMGSTTTYGTGDYLWSIPAGFTLADIHPNNGVVTWQVGSVLGLDQGTAFRSGAAVFYTFSPTNTIKIIKPATSLFWGQTQPHTWAVNDAIAISGFVKVVA